MFSKLFGEQKGRSGPRGELLPELHDGLPDSNNPSGLCPRCAKQSSFDTIGSLPVTFQKGAFVHHNDGSRSIPHVEQVTVLLCRHCKHGVVVVEEQFIGGQHHSKWERGGTVEWRGHHWWPLPETSVTKDVPEAIAAAFDEASRSLAANCPRAAAVMGRRTLEAIADRENATGRDLAARLELMKQQGKLHETLADWAKEVRLIGNRGAHFDPIQEVTAEDAKQLLNFVRELLKYLYELPASLARRRNPSPQP